MTTDVTSSRLGAAGFGTILGLSIGAVVPLGFARFAYALLLPAMRGDLGWTYAEAGALNTANAAGYLAGALVTAAIAARIGPARTFVIGLVLTGVGMLAAAATGDFALLLGLRVLVGISGALSFVTGAVLASQAGVGASRVRQSLFITVYFGGGGTGMVASGVLVPLLLDLGAGWRGGWLVLGALACAMVPFARRAARAAETPRTTAAPGGRVAGGVSLRATYVVYILFGAGYVGYMTFIIAFLRGETADSTTVAVFWIVLGLASLAAGFVWGRVFARLPGGWPQAIVLIGNAVGAALPLLGTSPTVLLLSALTFGATVMAMPSAMAAFVRKCLPEAAWTPVLGRLTVVFGLGQCLGPLATGYVSDTAFGISGGLLLSAAVLVVAAVVAMFQREPSPATIAAAAQRS